MATHSSVFAWRIPRTEEPGGLQSMVLPRVRTEQMSTNWNALAFWHYYKDGNDALNIITWFRWGFGVGFFFEFLKSFLIVFIRKLIPFSITAVRAQFHY